MYENRVSHPLEAIPLSRVGVGIFIKHLGNGTERDGHAIDIEIVAVEGDGCRYFHAGEVYFLHGALSPV